MRAVFIALSVIGVVGAIVTPFDKKPEPQAECTNKLFCFYKCDGKARNIEGQLSISRLSTISERCSYMVYGNVQVHHHSFKPIIEDVDRTYDVTMPGIFDKVAQLPGTDAILRVAPTDLHFLQTGQGRQTFATELLAVLKQYDFSGALLDFKIADRDRRHTANLIKTVRDTFEPDNKKLIMKIDAHRIRKLRAVLIYFAKYADYTMIDVNATESAMDTSRTSYLTPLWAENDEDAKDSIMGILEQTFNHIPVNKTVVMLPIQGRSYKLRETIEEGAVEARAGRGPTTAVGMTSDELGEAGIYGNEGLLGWNEICQKHVDITKEYDTTVNASSYITPNNEFVTYNGYDDVFRAKVSYLFNRSYPIALINIDSDDFLDRCLNGAFALTNLVADTLECPESTVTFDESDVETASGFRSIDGGLGEEEDETKQGCIRQCFYQPDRDLHRTFDFAQFDTRLCTHLVIGFVDIVDGTELTTTPAVRDTMAAYNEWMPLNGQRKPKLVMSIGGNQNREEWVAIETEGNREQLASNIVEFMNAEGIKWIDLHFFKDFKGENDKIDYAAFIKELKSRIDPSASLIVSVYPSIASRRLYDVPTLRDNADFIHLVGHAFINPNTSTITGHHAALTPPPVPEGAGDENDILDMTSFITYFSNTFMPRRRMIVSTVTAEAMTMTLIADNGLAKPELGWLAQGPGLKTRYAQIEGSATYYELIRVFHLGGVRKAWLKEVGAPAVALRNQFIAYDNPKSAMSKTRTISTMNVGGVGLWALEYESYGNLVEGVHYPLLRAMAEGHLCDACTKSDAITTGLGSRFKPLLDFDERCAVKENVVQTFCDYIIPKNTDASKLVARDLPWGKCDALIVRGITIGHVLAVAVPQSRRPYFDQLIVQRNTAVSKATKVIVSMQCVIDLSLLEGKTSKDIPASLLATLTATVDGLLNRIVSFARLHQFDGVELDCQSLADALPNEFDRVMVELSKRLKTVTGNNNCPLTLSLRVPQQHMYPAKTFNMTTVSRDIAHVVMAPSTLVERPIAVPHNNLYVLPKRETEIVQPAIDDTLKMWLRRPNKIHPSKIVIMLPSYGVSYDLLDDTVETVGAIAPYDMVKGLTKNVLPNVRDGKILQWQICDRQIQQDSPTRLNVTNVVATMRTATELIMFDNENTLIAKRGYASKYGLGGIGISSINDDDAEDNCRRGKFPHLTAINQQHC